MNIDNYIDATFNHYKKTDELLRLKEEISSNLKENIMSKQKQGMSEEAASQSAIEELGDLSVLLRNYPRNDSLFKILHWVSMGCLAFGLLLALFTCLGQLNLRGFYLSVGILHPFVDLQVAYLVWENKQHFRNIFRNIAAVATACSTFLTIDTLSSCLGYRYLNHTLKGIGPIISSEMILAIAAFATVLICLILERNVQKSANRTSF